MAECTPTHAQPHCRGSGALYESHAPSMAAFKLWLDETASSAFPQVDWSALYPWEEPAPEAVEACSA